MKPRAVLIIWSAKIVNHRGHRGAERKHRIDQSWAGKAGVLMFVMSALAWGQGHSAETLTNPLLPVGPDPWVEYKDGVYYYMNTTIKNLTLWKTRSMADLKTAPKKVLWTPPASGPYSHDIWAPEIHYLQGKWYIYFAG